MNRLWCFIFSKYALFIEWVMGIFLWQFCMFVVSHGMQIHIFEANLHFLCNNIYKLIKKYFSENVKNRKIFDINKRIFIIKFPWY